MAENGAIEILVKLKDVKPAVSRKLIVPVTLSYDQLHDLIQLSFGWSDSHMYSFQIKNRPGWEYIGNPFEMYMDEENLDGQAEVYPDLLASDLLYTYDFGAEWEHIITLKRVLTVEESENVQVPSCTWSRGENLADDGDDDEDDEEEEEVEPFDRQKLNQQLDSVFSAGK